MKAVADPGLQIRGGGGGGVSVIPLVKTFLWPFASQFGVKIREGLALRALPLDPPPKGVLVR